MLNEKRLIDADALMKYINETHSYAGLPMAAHICTMELLTYAPTVDAVEVVRCRDCKHYVIRACACRHENFNGVIHSDGFCSYGERRTTND
jgi:hypothetical protein